MSTEARTAPMATCPIDGAPLISTMLFAGAEFYCLECGGQFGYLEPQGAKVTPELTERLAALQAEWDEHAGPKLRCCRVWFDDCEQCRTEAEKVGDYHYAHATPAERTAHAEAVEWLAERAKLGQA